MRQKHILSPIIAVLAALTPLFFTACEEDLPLYSDHQAYLNFNYNYYNSDSVINYSFVYSGGKERDTVWLNLTTMGFLSDEDRTFELQQVATGVNDAVAGTHYVSFDSEEEKPYLVIKAGETTARVPVFVLRDVSLEDTAFNLRVEVKPNGTFEQGYKEQRYKLVTITSQLTKPEEWTMYMDYYFGEWGPVKHQFMIDATGENWDNNYITSVEYDFGMVSYLISKLDRALEQENARRAAEGLPYLQEADGTLVAFGW